MIGVRLDAITDFTVCTLLDSSLIEDFTDLPFFFLIGVLLIPFGFYYLYMRIKHIYCIHNPSQDLLNYHLHTGLHEYMRLVKSSIRGLRMKLRLIFCLAC